MHWQMQQLQQRINQLQRELSNISNQLSSLSSMSYQSFSGNAGQMGGYGLGQGMSSMGGQSFVPGNIASYTPSHSPKAGVGDSGQNMGGYGNLGGYGLGSGMSGFSGQQSYQYSPQTSVSDYNYPLSGSYSSFAGGQNIASFTAPSATAGFSEVNSSPTGRQDYGVGGSQQPYRLGR